MLSAGANPCCTTSQRGRHRRINERPRCGWLLVASSDRLERSSQFVRSETSTGHVVLIEGPPLIVGARDSTELLHYPRRAVKTAHPRAVENSTPVGGHFQNRTLGLLRFEAAGLI
jgi:hypothetical protein